MAFDRSAEAQAAPGFAEFHFDDGSYIGVSHNAGVVSVIQMQGGTQGRGAAFMSADQAKALAAAINQAAELAAPAPEASVTEEASSSTEEA